MRWLFDNSCLNDPSQLVSLDLDREYHNRYPKFKEPFLDREDGMVVKQLWQEKCLWKHQLPTEKCGIGKQSRQFFDNRVNLTDGIGSDRPHTFSIEPELIGYFLIFSAVIFHGMYEMVKFFGPSINFRIDDTYSDENIILINSLETLIDP